MIKIVFFGTPEYVIPIVEKLDKTFRSARERGLVAVVTQPPKPSGRGNKIEYSEVDHWAHKHHIKIIFDLDQVPEADIAIVASYGKIIPERVIRKFKFGILNVHPSLLPKYRGASPVQATIASGDTETGLTIIKMDDRMDHGPIVSRFKDDVLSHDTTETLRNRLFDRSADFLVELIPSYIEGRARIKQQDHDIATFTTLIKKEDAYINPVHLNELLNGNEIKDKLTLSFIKESQLDYSPELIECFIRAMQPWPVAWTHVKTSDKDSQTKRLKLHKAHVEDNTLVLDEVQLEGKSVVAWKQFIEGYPNYVFKK